MQSVPAGDGWKHPNGGSPAATWRVPTLTLATGQSSVLGVVDGDGLEPQRSPVTDRHGSVFQWGT
jgi:hypothetical protein